MDVEHIENLNASEINDRDDEEIGLFDGIDSEAETTRRSCKGAEVRLVNETVKRMSRNEENINRRTKAQKRLDILQLLFC